MERQLDQMKNFSTIEIPSGRSEYFDYLLQIQNAVDPFPFSHGPENPSCGMEPIKALEEYTSVLADYQFLENIDLENCDYGTPDSPRSGYKIHLNVAKENIMDVSQYLKTRRFLHKYLSGGEPQDGKVFTVYAGSKRIVQKISQETSQELGDKLSQPVNSDEIEFAPNIIGRFDMQDPKYHRLGLGIRGISMRMEDVAIVRRRTTFTPERQRELFAQAFTKSYNDLADRFGVYFHG